MQFRTETGETVETEAVGGRLFLTTEDEGRALTASISPSEARELASVLDAFAAEHGE